MQMLRREQAQDCLIAQQQAKLMELQQVRRSSPAALPCFKR